MSTRHLTALLFASALFSGNAFAAACGDVLVANEVLTSNLSCTGPGLIIGADNIELDCNGYSITGAGSDVGIRLDGRTGVAVVNCFVRNYSVGILLVDSDNNKLVRNGVTDSTSTGSGGFTLTSGSDHNAVFENRSWSNNGRGFVVANSEGNSIHNNSALVNGFRGFDVVNAHYNKFYQNYAGQNTSAGFVVQASSTGNYFEENQVTGNQSEGFAMFSAGNALHYNVSDSNNTWGIRDTTGLSNAYLGNSCVGNGSGPASPAGPC